MNERNRENFLLNEAKNVGDAQASASRFFASKSGINEVQEEIGRLQPFDAPQNKSIRLLQTFFGLESF